MTEERDPTTRFGDRVAAYAAARPGYPDAVATALLARFGLGEGTVVADLGSGTGLSCVPFLRAGCRVIGVEPNAGMRAVGDAALAAWPGFRSAEGTAEATGLAEATVDLAIAAQAAHWFRPDETRRELARILRPPRPVALLWNDRPATGTPFAEGYEAIMVRFGTGYGPIRERHGGPTAEMLLGAAAAARPAIELPNDSLLDLPTLIARVESASYMPQPGAPGHVAMIEALTALFAATAEDGRVRMPMTTFVYTGLLAPTS